MPDPTDEQWQQVEAELYAGRKIQAIKFYRQATGCDLKTAKDTLDEHESRLRGQFPDRFTAKAGGGCGSAVVLAALGIAGLALAVL